MPKLIPRTHNDYAYNSKTAAPVCGVSGDSVLLARAADRAQPAARLPGHPGLLLQRRQGGARARRRGPRTCCRSSRSTGSRTSRSCRRSSSADQQPRRSAGTTCPRVRVIQSGGQRLQPEVRLKTQRADPERVRAGELRHVGGDAHLRAPRRPGRGEARDRRPADLPRRRGAPAATTTTTRCRRARSASSAAAVPTRCAATTARRSTTRAQFTPDGFYRSGDLMRQHPSGNYMVEGRKKDLINRGGEKISAEEIENLILQHPAVQNVACVPMPDPELGERMCACVDPAPGQLADARGAGRVPRCRRRSPSSSCRSG